jgi:hypothetical protein
VRRRRLLDLDILCRHHLDRLALIRVRDSVLVLAQQVLSRCISYVAESLGEGDIPGFERRGSSKASATGSSSEGAMS